MHLEARGKPIIVGTSLFYCVVAFIYIDVSLSLIATISK
jgi:hypothetical protein